jgi:ribosomal protein L30/L7E
MMAVQIAGITDAPKTRSTLRLIRIRRTNHTLIRPVKLKAKLKPRIRKRKLLPRGVYEFNL